MKSVESVLFLLKDFLKPYENLRSMLFFQESLLAVSYTVRRKEPPPTCRLSRNKRIVYFLLFLFFCWGSIGQFPTLKVEYQLPPRIY